MTSDIVKTKPCRIVMESLNVSGMMKNKHLSKAIANQGLYEFKKMIEYKCAKHGIEFVEADNLIKSLFTEKSKGNVPDSIFKKMLIDYENEQNELNAPKMETERSLHDSGRSESNITQVVKFLKDCMNFETLDRDTLPWLIDTITVSEGYIVDGVKNYDITIQYRFIGNVV